MDRNDRSEPPDAQQPEDSGAPEDTDGKDPTATEPPWLLGIYKGNLADPSEQRAQEPVAPADTASTVTFPEGFGEMPKGFGAEPYPDPPTAAHQALEEQEPPKQLKPTGPRQVARPPNWFARTIYHMATTVVIMVIFAAVFGVSIVVIFPGPKTAYWCSIVCTIAGFFIVLRWLRGSVLDARKEQISFLRNRLERITDPSVTLTADEGEIDERIDGQMGPSEIMLWGSRPHPLCLIAEITKWPERTKSHKIFAGLFLAPTLVVSVVGGIYLLINSRIWWWCPGFAWIVIYALLIISDWWRRKYAITTKKMLVVDGLIGTVSKRMSREQITDDRVEISGWAVILTWLRITYLPPGTFTLETPGQDQQIYKIDYVPYAVQIAAVFGLSE